ncbi:MAG: EAL domain-containing protein [Sutterella sp.]|nr:EAL domain-containing protein [Sutterella sp.]
MSFCEHASCCCASDFPCPQADTESEFLIHGFYADDRVRVAPETARRFGLCGDASDLRAFLGGSMPSAKDRALFEALYEELGDGEERKAYFRLPAPDGSLRWWRILLVRCAGRLVGRAVCLGAQYLLRSCSEYFSHVEALSRIFEILRVHQGDDVWFVPGDEEAVHGSSLIIGALGGSLIFTAKGAGAPEPQASYLGPAISPAEVTASLSQKAGGTRRSAQGLTLAEELLLLSSVERPEGAFTINVQPIFAQPGRTMIGAEALLRLKKGRVSVPPAVMVPLFESSELAVALGRQFFEPACGIAARIVGQDPKAFLSFNYSPMQTADTQFADWMKITAAEEGVPLSAFMIELTESRPIPNPDEQRRLFAELRSMGMRTALDDFGTGFNSLDKLLSDRYDVVKIGGSVSRLLLSRSETNTFFTHLLSAFHATGALVCIECIESEEEAHRMKALGADWLQGYHLARPMPLGELPAGVFGKI